MDKGIFHENSINFGENAKLTGIVKILFTCKFHQKPKLAGKNTKKTTCKYCENSILACSPKNIYPQGVYGLLIIVLKLN